MKAMHYNFGYLKPTPIMARNRGIEDNIFIQTTSLKILLVVLFLMYVFKILLIFLGAANDLTSTLRLAYQIKYVEI